MTRITLHEKNMLVRTDAQTSLFVGSHSPFNHSQPDILALGGILAPVSGTLEVSAENRRGEWAWEYNATLGDEWEHTARDEFMEVRDKAFCEMLSRNAAPQITTWAKCNIDPDGEWSEFSISVEKLAALPFPGHALVKIMHHDAQMPVVLLQSQLVGPAWGKLTVRAEEDLDGWCLHYRWEAGDEIPGNNYRVAGMDVIDNWNDALVEQRVRKYLQKWGRETSMRDLEYARHNWRRMYPPTALDDMARIVPAQLEEFDDDDEL